MAKKTCPCGKPVYVKGRCRSCYEKNRRALNKRRKSLSPQRRRHWPEERRFDPTHEFCTNNSALTPL